MRRSAPLLMVMCVVSCAGAEPSTVDRGPVVARAVFDTGATSVRTDILEVADTDAERRRGLMGRTSMDPDSGMVFVFDGEEDGAFWMKDTPIPLSIAFWSDDDRLVDILEMEPCEADPCPTYPAQAPFTHALEMNAGWFDDHGIEIGDRVELTIAGE